jgi:hypothetical protein
VTNAALHAVVWGAIALYALVDAFLLFQLVSTRLARGKPLVPNPFHGGLRR